MNEAKEFHNNFNTRLQVDFVNDNPRVVTALEFFGNYLTKISPRHILVSVVVLYILSVSNSVFKYFLLARASVFGLNVYFVNEQMNNNLLQMVLNTLVYFFIYLGLAMVFKLPAVLELRKLIADRKQ